MCCTWGSSGSSNTGKICLTDSNTGLCSEHINSPLEASGCDDRETRVSPPESPNRVACTRAIDSAEANHPASCLINVKGFPALLDVLHVCIALPARHRHHVLIANRARVSSSRGLPRTSGWKLRRGQGGAELTII